MILVCPTVVLFPIDQFRPLLHAYFVKKKEQLKKIFCKIQQNYIAAVKESLRIKTDTKMYDLFISPIEDGTEI